ncbi:MAG: PBP1A family penicillin-binding protein [Cyanobacteria bacterium SZAS LIN-2]|nr:PBP1A family penicillin-binding protein [Cyanobacteria bacterium SZAS LIN-3]MBS1996339.1 PBP1A family penicillin-binding protein [Cyanobacteria bacterium SZAS LIN-2]
MARRRSEARRKNQGPLASVGHASRAVMMVLLAVAAIAAGYGGSLLYVQLKEIPDVTMVERFEPIEAIQIFDRQDKLICTVEGDEDRRVVPLNQVSTPMQQAMLAAEDHHFYEHNGINFFSIIRATFANMQAGHVVEGGSTITQQLAKNLFFKDAGRTFDRKIREAYVAWDLERRYSKERILNMYLNQVYFGNNAYGIERAASRYFDKSAAGLTIAESAFIAGLVKAPSELGTVQNRQAAIDRQREIIDKMVEYGYITENQAKSAKAQKLAFKKGTNPLQKYPYYITYVLETLRERFSQAEMRTQGLKVYTNLDPVAQELAEKTLAEGIKKAPKGVTQGALVSISVRDGEVMAMVGGVGDFIKHQFNRATNPHTVGSSFKPFVYLTAFTKGVLTPDSIIDDSPLVIHSPWGQADYAPKNFDHKFYGRIPVRRALALSRNIPSVKVGQMVGMDSVIETARLAGITAKLDPNLSLALGSSAISPLDMAGAYSTFARAGVVIKPQVLRKIENNRGRVIEVFEPKQDRPFQLEPIARLVDCMQDVVRWGTGTQAKLADRPVAGKTGTADEGKDIWFIGFTPDMVTAVWAGNDENKPISGHNVTGGVVMAKIWHDYNEAFYKARPTPPGSFMVPSPVTPEELAAKNKGTAAGGDENKDSVSPASISAAVGDAAKTGDNVTLKPMEGRLDDTKETSGAALAPSSNGTGSAPTPGQSGSTSSTASGGTSGSGASTSSGAALAGTSESAPPIAPQIANPESSKTPELAAPKAQSLWSNSPMDSNKSTKELIANPKRLYPYNSPTIWMPVNGQGKN